MLGLVGRTFREGQAASPTGNPFMYTGQKYARVASGSGEDWYDYRARHLRADAGRFVQRDPLGYVDGASLYAYAGLSPLVNVDPMGTNLIGPGGGGGGTKEEKIAAGAKICAESRDYKDLSCEMKCWCDQHAKRLAAQKKFDGCISDGIGPTMAAFFFGGTAGGTVVAGGAATTTTLTLSTAFWPVTLGVVSVGGLAAWIYDDANEEKCKALLQGAKIEITNEYKNCLSDC
jgi:RHS repeat-associated protein